MSAVPPLALPRAPSARAIDPSLAIALAGFAAMYVPVYWTAANGIWTTDDNAHGPLILAVLLWLFWSVRREIVDATVRQTAATRWAGIALFSLGLLIYLVGRVADVLMFAIASQPFVVAGSLLLLRGSQALRKAWFGVFYFVFMIPLPGTLVDQITGPLKQWISYLVVEVLYRLGYPIARNGVTLEIGQYQMLVADACSGLHSMYSLAALGTLFMYIMSRRSLLHNGIMLASILPIAFIANLARVAVLVLITYHFGDEAGQGFLHGAAGMVLMGVSLVAFFLLDWVLAKVMGEGHRSASGAPVP